MAVHPARVIVAAVGPLAATAVEAGDAWLTDEERARLAVMGSRLRRDQFLAGHWLARAFAGRVLHVEVDGCTLVRADDGSPRLEIGGRASDWHVSLTHSLGHVACALAPGPVGVDLEFPRAGRDLEGLARFAFSPEEATRLAALPEAGRSAEFHRVWSLKEARGKRLGEGMLPRRSRRVTAVPCGPEEADAAAWPLGDGTLSLACTGIASAIVEGLPGPGPPGYWRFLPSQAA